MLTRDTYSRLLVATALVAALVSLASGAMAQPSVNLASANAHTAGFTNSSRLSELGLGPVRIGMTVDEAEEAAGESLKLSYNVGRGDCGSGEFSDGPRFVAVMVISDVVRRIEAYIGYRKGRRIRSLTRTTRGIRIGSSEKSVVRKYGSLRREKHTYEPGGEYLTYISTRNNRYRIVFETNERNRVTGIRGGRTPEVGYVEGCA